MIIKMYTFVSNAASHREKESRPDENKHPNSILETVSLSTEDTRPFKSTKILNAVNKQEVQLMKLDQKQLHR